MKGLSEMGLFNSDDLMKLASEMMQKSGFSADSEAMSQMKSVFDKVSGMSREELLEYNRELTAQAMDMMGMTEEEARAQDREYRQRAAEQRRSDMEKYYSPSLAPKLEPYRKNTIFAYPSKDSEVTKGCSKIGGSPDVPADFKWYIGELGEPLTFLMQINLAELHPFDAEGQFGDKGILYFFYDLESQPWMWDDDSGKGYGVYYYEGDISALEPMKFPAECPDSFDRGCADMNCVIDEARIKFFADDSLPCYDDYVRLSGDSCGGMEYEATASRLLGYDINEYAENYCKFGGWSDPMQNSLSGEFEPDSVMLCQLTTYESEKCGYMFGDGGRLYFSIKSSALEAHDLSDVKFVLQCG